MQAALTLLLLTTLTGQTSQATRSGEAREEIELLKARGRQGFFIALGTRGAYLGLDAEPVGNLGFFQGGTFNFRFGEMVNDLIGFGMNIETGGGQTSDWAGGYGGLMVEVQLTPFDFDLAFRGSVGVAAFGLGRKEEAEEREDDPSGSYGSYYGLGLSYDWFPFHDEGDSGGFSIASFVEGRIMPLGDILIGGAFVGVELTYFFGFDKNRLDLSVEKAFQK